MTLAGWNIFSLPVQSIFVKVFRFWEIKEVFKELFGTNLCFDQFVNLVGRAGLKVNHHSLLMTLGKPVRSSGPLVGDRYKAMAPWTLATWEGSTGESSRRLKNLMEGYSAGQDGSVGKVVGSNPIANKGLFLYEISVKCSLSLVIWKDNFVYVRWICNFYSCVYMWEIYPGI